jgi:hypothetical protein
VVGVRSRRRNKKKRRMGSSGRRHKHNETRFRVNLTDLYALARSVSGGGEQKESLRRSPQCGCEEWTGRRGWEYKQENKR